MDRMSPLDASFLHVEDAVSHMHIGSVAVFEGPPPAARGVRGDGRGQAARRCRGTARRCGSCRSISAGRCGSTIRISTSAITSATPRSRRPGGDQELRNLVGRVMSQQLDRHKPLWEMWIVEGLEHGHWALVSKVHHCMVDGVSGTDLLTVVLDSEPEPARPMPDDWHAEPEPSDARLVRRRARRSRRQPLRAAPRGPFGDACAASGRCSSSGESRAGCARGPASFGRRRRRRSTARSVRIAAGTGRAPRSPTSRPCGARSAAPSTTSCSPSSTRGFRDLLLARDERRRGSRRADARAGVGAHHRRTRHVQQSRVGDDRRAAGRARRPRRAPRGDPRADGRAQGVEAGGRRRGAHVAVGVRAVDAARARHAGRDADSAAQRQHRDHQRSRARSTSCTRAAGR